MISIVEDKKKGKQSTCMIQKFRKSLARNKSNVNEVCLLDN